MAVLIAGVAGTPGPALAYNFAAAYADNGAHYIYLSSSLSGVQRAGIWDSAVYALGNATDMTVGEDTTLDNSTDVWAYATSTPPASLQNTFAWALCINGYNSSTGGCDRFELVINNDNPHGNYRAVGCHEVGHTVGLQHAYNYNAYYAYADYTCMRSGPDHTYYNPHDKSHINGRY